MIKKPLLQIKNLSCGYGDKTIIDNLSFDLYENEKLCIIGPNGSGKTTLLRAINHILPFEGEVVACGKSVKKSKRKEVAKIIGLMSQFSNVTFSYSVFETVMMGRYPHRTSLFDTDQKKDKEIVEEALRITGSYDLKDRSITELSGGQLQRVMLARVFAQEPNIILLDEPTNHLDLTYQIELMEYLKEWAKKDNRAIISVLHDINMALSFADKILLLEDGKCQSFTTKNAFPIEKLNNSFNMDVGKFMTDSLYQWKQVSHITRENNIRKAI